MLAARRGILAGNAFIMTVCSQHDNMPLHPSSFVVLSLKASQIFLYLSSD